MIRNGFIKPSEFALARIAEYNKSSDIALKEGEVGRLQSKQVDALHESFYALKESGLNRKAQHEAFCAGVKKALLVECINHLYQTVVERNMYDDSARTITKNLVNKLVEEQGVTNLLNRFKSQNTLLSEYSMLVDKYYDIIVEEVNTNKNTDDADDSEDKETMTSDTDSYAQNFGIDVKIKDNFFDDLKTVDPDDVILSIRNRVSDAVQQFIDSNTADKMDIQDIISQVKERVNTAKISTDVQESYKSLGGKYIADIRRKPKKLFGYMVESVSANVMKDEVMKEHFMKDGHLDMQKIVENCELMYTLLEMVNTTEMVNVNEEYMESVVQSLK